MQNHDTLPLPARAIPAGTLVRIRRGLLAWDVRYVILLLVTDLAVGLAAGTLAFGIRFGNDVPPYNRDYITLSALLPLGFMGALALSRAYERRFLFVGTDEYQRVLRAGLTLTAALAVV